jgi:cytoskeletal protein RodZ
VKSFLRTYGEYLRIDSRGLLDEYRRIYERVEDHEALSVTTITRERERAAKGPLLPVWVWIALVLVIVVGALWFVGHGSGNKTPTSGATGTRSKHAHHGSHHATVPSHTTTTTVPSDVTVSMVPTGAEYVCATEPSGKKLINGLIYQAGQTVKVLTAPVILLDLGNASMQLTVNGRHYPIAASSNAIGLRVTPAGVTPDKNAPTCG